MKYSKTGCVYYEGVWGSISKAPLIVDLAVILRWVVCFTCLSRYWVHIEYEVG